MHITTVTEAINAQFDADHARWMEEYSDGPATCPGTDSYASDVTVERVCPSVAALLAYAGTVKFQGEVTYNENDGQPGAVGDTAVIEVFEAPAYPDVFSPWVQHRFEVKVLVAMHATEVGGYQSLLEAADGTHIMIYSDGESGVHWAYVAQRA